MKKCILYDCDGVLVDSEHIASEVDSDFLNALGYKISPEECIQLFLGKSVPHIQSIIFERFGFTLSNEHLNAIHDNIYTRFELELTPLIFETISYFHHQNIKQYVCSTSKESWILKALKSTDQLKFFNKDMIFSGDTLKIQRSKSSLYHFAVQQSGFNLSECIAIEDSPTGIEAALNANLPVIGFLGGSHTQYSWYKKKILSFNIPLAHNKDELQALLRNNFKITGD